jgi:hypothetical protein
MDKKILPGSRGTFGLLKKAEAVFVLLFLCVGIWTLFSFFKDAHNPNDLNFKGIPAALALSENQLQITGYVKNWSDVPLKSISVIGDAYDENGKIIGTNSFTANPGAYLSPSDTLFFGFTMEIYTGCRSVRSFMTIPRSHLGTGKIQVNSIDW